MSKSKNYVFLDQNKIDQIYNNKNQTRILDIGIQIVLCYVNFVNLNRYVHKF